MIDPCKLAKELGVDQCECHSAFHEECDFILANGTAWEKADPWPVAYDRIRSWYEEGQTVAIVGWINAIGVASFVKTYRRSRVWATFEGMKAAGVKEVGL